MLNWVFTVTGKYDSLQFCNSTKVYGIRVLSKFSDFYFS